VQYRGLQLDWGETVKVRGVLLLAYVLTLAQGLKNILLSFTRRRFVSFLLEGEYFEDQKLSAAEYTCAQRRLFHFTFCFLKIRRQFHSLKEQSSWKFLGEIKSATFRTYIFHQ